MNKSHWNSIIQNISSNTNQQQEFLWVSTIDGGCISQSFQLKTNQQQFMVKTHKKDQLEMFIAEYHALNELQQVKQLQIPQPICYGSCEDKSYLVMQYLPLSANGDQLVLGHGVANMHQIRSEKFGWKQNNTIGSTPQSNQYSDNWTEFWFYQRIKPQLELLAKKGYHQQLLAKSEQIYLQIEKLFKYHQPQASLLHGDLWSGNFSFTMQGSPVIFDPALYYGDRETDIAMTELFGGFNQRFYQGYQEVFPLADDYQQRKEIYNLYHILNHANLFAGSYISQAQQIIQQFI